MHFSVIVIGTDPEEQLEKFDENLECDEYFVDFVTDKDKERMMKFYERQGEVFNSFEECYEKNREEWNGGAWRKDCNGEWREYSTRNPDGFWDWYEIGGRFAGKILVREGVEFERPNFSWGWSVEGKEEIFKQRRTDSALLKDIENIDEIKCWAFVYNGAWHENGDEYTFQQIVDVVGELEPDTLITIVDCHV